MRFLTAQPIAIKQVRARAAALTVLEVLIALVIVGLILSIVVASLLSTQRQVTEGSLRQLVNSRARQVAELLVGELRDLNAHPADVGNPPLPFVGFTPSNGDEFRYRLLTGVDGSVLPAKAVLSPTRASNAYRSLHLSGSGDIVIAQPATGPVVLASQVADLELGLDTSTSPGRLTIKVRVSREGPALDTSTGQGELIVGTCSLTVSLRNDSPNAD